MAKDEKYTFQFGRIPVNVKMNRASSPYNVSFSNYDAETKGKARELLVDENRAFKDGVLDENKKISEVIMKSKVKGYNMGNAKNPNVVFFDDAELEKFQTTKSKTIIQMKVEGYSEIPPEMVYKVYVIEPAENDNYYGWIAQRFIANNLQARLFVVESNQYREAILQFSPSGYGRLTVLMFPSELKIPAEIEIKPLGEDEAQAVDFCMEELKKTELDKLESKKKEVIKDLLDVKLGIKKPEEIVEKPAVAVGNDLMKMLIQEKKKKTAESKTE